MNLKSKEGVYATLEKRPLALNNTNASLLERTLHEESFEKLEETLLNPNMGNATFEKEKQQDMPLLQKITLGPIEKYQKWNR